VDAVNEFAELEWKRPGTKQAVVTAAIDTPKLIGICCIVLAIELALLVCSSLMSVWIQGGGTRMASIGPDYHP
jgi:hypothetical protein